MPQIVDGSFRFLDLIRELRDNVYEKVLLSSRPPPSSPECEGGWKTPGNTVRSSFEDHNHYSANDGQSIGAPLLLICQQISKEVREALARLTKLNCSPFRLDLMLLDERELYITWLAFPLSTNHIPRLDVDFRLFGDVEGKETTMDYANGRNPVLAWGLLTLMQRFLQRGPDFLAPRFQGLDVWIGELSVNVFTPPSPPPGGYASRFLRHRHRKGHMSPADMLNWLTWYMDYLLRRTRHTPPYARLIYERIKRMSFSLDGVEQKSWELATLQPEYTR
ncbi:MAG: hypothetical protein Q9207_006669 [Kuettlingeria erythrocarpa]